MINMKKINDEYADEKLEPILEKYIEDENIIELYNSVIDVDEELMPLAMFFAQRVDITKYLDARFKEIPDIEEEARKASEILEQNKDLISDVAGIVSFDNPNMSKVLDILNKAE